MLNTFTAADWAHVTRLAHELPAASFMRPILFALLSENATDRQGEAEFS